MPLLAEKPNAELRETSEGSWLDSTISNLSPNLDDLSSSTSTRAGYLIIHYYHSNSLTGDRGQNFLDETRSSLLSHTDALIEQLSDCQKLSDDWDGDGALAITAEAAARARLILELVGAPAEALGLESSVDPLPNGGLDMEWISRYGNQLLVEILPQGGGINFALCKKIPAGQRRYWSNRLFDSEQVLYLSVQSR